MKPRWNGRIIDRVNERIIVKRSNESMNKEEGRRTIKPANDLSGKGTIEREGGQTIDERKEGRSKN